MSLDSSAQDKPAYSFEIQPDDPCKLFECVASEWASPPPKPAEVLPSLPLAAVSEKARPPIVDVDKLVENLGAPKQATRESATKTLAAAGTQALPNVVRALSSGDREVLVNASRVIDKMISDKLISPATSKLIPTAAGWRDRLSADDERIWEHPDHVMAQLKQYGESKPAAAPEVVAAIRALRDAVNSPGYRGKGHLDGQKMDRLLTNRLDDLTDRDKALAKFKMLNLEWMPWCKQQSDMNPNLAGLKYLSNLEELYFPSNCDYPLTDSGLANLQYLTNLRQLSAVDTEMTDKSMKMIGGLSQLESLQLSRNPRITDEGVKSLLQLSKLHNLMLSCCPQITDASAAHLSKLTGLKTLSLNETALTDAAIPHLIKLTNLVGLDLRGTKLTEEGRSTLRKALPKCNVLTNAEVTR